MKYGWMIDTETLGLHPTSIVREMAAVLFNLETGEVVDEYMTYFDLQEQLDSGRTLSFKTLHWLLEKPENVEKLKAPMTAIRLGDSCRLMYAALSTRANVSQVWFARPQFDIPLIATLFESHGLDLPWAYDAVHDLRTLMTLAGMSARDPETKEFAEGLELHTALGDCYYQVRCYREAMQRLGRIER